MFIAILVVWAVVPFVQRDSYALDANHYYVGDELVRLGQFDQIYPSPETPFNQQPGATALFCPLLPSGQPNCTTLIPGFSSPPPALALARLTAWFGPSGNVWTLRLVGAACLVAGMAALWNRLADRRGRAGSAGLHLCVAALLVTPFMIDTLRLGQTTPILFLSACLGISSDRRARNVVVAALWVVSTVLKLFPVMLVIVLVWQRRWQILRWSGIVLAAIVGASLILGPISLYGYYWPYVSSLARVSGSVDDSGSIDRLVEPLSASLASRMASGLRAAALIVAGLLTWRRTSRDAQWAVAWLVVTFVQPEVWWHYSWVALPAVVMVVAADEKRSTVWVMVVAAAMAVVSLAAHFTAIVGWTTAVVLLAVTVLVLSLASRPGPLRAENEVWPLA